MKPSIFIKELIINSDKGRLKDFMMIEINEMLDNAEINLNIQDSKASNNAAQKNIPLSDQKNTNCNQENQKDTKEKHVRNSSNNPDQDFEIRKRRFA